MLPPHWIDNVVESVIRENNAQAIARAVTHSPKFLAAIEEGIRNANAATPGKPGPSHAQYVRQAILEAIESRT